MSGVNLNTGLGNIITKYGMINTDKTNGLNKPEIEAALKSTTNDPAGTAFLNSLLNNNLFTQIDTTKDGTISFAELSNFQKTSEEAINILQNFAYLNEKGEIVPSRGALGSRDLRLIAENNGDGYGFPNVKYEKLEIAIMGALKFIGQTDKDFLTALNAFQTNKDYGPFIQQSNVFGRATWEKLTNALITKAGGKDFIPGPQLIKYKVKKGDILKTIAPKFNTTVEAIMKENKIKNENRIEKDQVLIIPTNTNNN